MMIIGCDLHTRYQQVAMVDTDTGEMLECRLEHANGEARAFYAARVAQAFDLPSQSGKWVGAGPGFELCFPRITLYEKREGDAWHQAFQINPWYLLVLLQHAALLVRARAGFRGDS